MKVDCSKFKIYIVNTRATSKKKNKGTASNTAEKWNNKDNSRNQWNRKHRDNNEYQLNNMLVFEKISKIENTSLTNQENRDNANNQNQVCKRGHHSRS